MTSKFLLLEAASKAHRKTGSEFNFPAEIIMYLDMMDHSLKRDEYIRKSAEEAMLQLGFLNMGVNPESSFIMRAHSMGWRFDGDFRRQDA